MLLQKSIENLQTLRLNGFLEAFNRMNADPESGQLSFEDRLGLLLDHEVTYRESKRQKRLLKVAQLRDKQACVEDVDYKYPRELDRNLFLSLKNMDWLRRQQNVIFIGPTGIGKTYLACALAQLACRQGLSAKYIRLPRLFEKLQAAHGEGSYNKFLSQLTKIELLLLDDWGIGNLESSQRQDLLEILEDRHGIKSTIITTQLPIKHWHEYVGEATIADAMIDRLLAGAYTIDLKGDSMRDSAMKVDGKETLGSN